MTGRRLHRSATIALSTVMVLIGVVLVIEDLAGTATLSPRLLLGALFLAAGCGRLYLEARRGSRR
jgi:hypothetical protein